MRSGRPSEAWLDEAARERFRARRRGSYERTPRPREHRLPLWLQVDPFLTFYVVALTVIGLVMVHSASAALSADRTGTSLGYFRVQLLAAAAGLLGAIAALRAPIHLYARHAKGFVFVAVGAMLLVFLPGIGQSVGGFRRWVRLAVFPFQPVELAKLAVVLYVAHFLSSDRKDVQRLLRGVLPNLIVMAAFVGLLMLQPDFGSAVLLCAVVFAMLLAGGARVSHIAVLVALGAVPGYLLIVSDDYRYERVMSFVKWIGGTTPAPDDRGYQIWQSYNALSSGGLFGVGLGDGLYKLFYLPAPHTDFIFAVIGEELGFVGAALVVLLFAMVVTRGVQIALRVRDPFPQMVAFGLTMLLGLQALVNIAMVLGLLPTKGFTLPFLSYGGSSLMMTLIEAGVLLNVSRYAALEEAE